LRVSVAGVITGLVLVQEPLNLALTIAARQAQVFSRVVQFILVHGQLGLRHVQLLLESFLSAFAGRSDGLGQFINLLLVHLDNFFSLAHAFGEFVRLRAELNRMLLRVAQRSRKCQVDFVVCDPQCVLRDAPFFRG